MNRKFGRAAEEHPASSREAELPAVIGPTLDSSSTASRRSRSAEHPDVAASDSSMALSWNVPAFDLLPSSPMKRSSCGFQRSPRFSRRHRLAQCAMVVGTLCALTTGNRLRPRPDASRNLRM